MSKKSLNTDVAILTFDGFNELDLFIALGILNGMKGKAWKVQITCPSDKVTSMNGVAIEAQQPLAFFQQADVVIFGSGIYTRKIAKDKAMLTQLKLDPSKQVIGAQCSGTLLLATLGLLNGISKPWVIEAGIDVLNQPFIANGNVVTSGGCLSSQYLASWVISKMARQSAAEATIHYVAPVVEKEKAVVWNMAVVEPYIER